MQSSGSIHGKILNYAQLNEIRSGLANEGLTLVQCHGCFDIVHPGHIRHLQFAASQGNRLIVSITADAFVGKGPGRPMFSHVLRAENLAALEFVDWVYIHHEPTAVNLLDELKPDIYIKGAEYASKHDPRFSEERVVVEKNNGRVVFSSGDVVFSSTAIVNTIQGVSRPEPGLAGLDRVRRAHDLSTLGIKKIFEKAMGKRVLVFGETIIDTYTQCQWPEIAEEHPMLSLCPVSSCQYDGGAAVVALHLAALGADPVLCTPIPRSSDSSEFMARMAASGVEVIGIDVDGEMPEKKRFLVEREKIIKLDCTGMIRLGESESRLLVDRLVRSQGDIDGLIFVDFGLGLFRDGLASILGATFRDRVEYIGGDISGIHADLLSMHSADVLCPSEVELRRAMNDSASPIGEVAHRAVLLLDAGAIVVTRGSKGLMIVTRDSAMDSLPALVRDPVDAMGCGDALLAGLSFARLGGGDLAQAAYIGSLGAGVAGSVLGNVPVSGEDILVRAQMLGAQLAHSIASSDGYEIEPKSAKLQAKQREI